MVEIDGARLAAWLSWRYDHCYNDELNRAGVLRAIDVPPEGGMTGFADDVDLCRSLSPDLLEAIEKYDRRMQRTTIKGDYGLGYFENNAEGHRILSDTEV